VTRVDLQRRAGFEPGVDDLTVELDPRARWPDKAVLSSTDAVIHKSSPDSATTDSPASSFISSTGTTVPIT